ncbi:MAG: CmpA/NrtA family ABC transporter substrate-binding protein [Pseudomonadota bacterium]
MKLMPLRLGFIPLVDAAPLIIAQEMGFAAEEGLTFDLQRAPSWSTLRDLLSFGQVDAAHMLAPIPVASALGLGGQGTPLTALLVLSVNGNVIGVSRSLEARLRDAGHDFGFQDARQTGKALLSVMDAPIRIGVPFPFSMHAELVYYWLSALGLPAPQGLDVRTIPPPLMADALRSGEVDAFCVGEPWGSRSVEMGVGALILPTKAIWAFAPEKVLATRLDWAEAQPDLRGRLIRAVWRAGRWLGQPTSLMLAAEILSRRAYLDLPSDLIERALTGRLLIDALGAERDVPGFVSFHAGAAGFPWRSQGEWIATHLAARTGLDRTSAAKAGQAVFRSDLYRQALAGTAVDLPGASAKVEGALAHETAVASAGGHLVLQPDAFFDGRIFEPLASK